MELIQKEVYFDQYCPLCKYTKLSENEEPCCECLAGAANDYSHKPVKFEKFKRKS